MPYLFPIKGSYIRTQRYGENLLGYERFGLKGHNGIDLACATGTPIIAPEDGRITASEGRYPDNDTQKGYGNTVILLGWPDTENVSHEWTFGHLLRPEVKLNQLVLAGELCGLTDNSGFSTGPHLHITLKRIRMAGGNRHVLDADNGYFGAIDPWPLLSAPESSYPADTRYGQPKSLWLEVKRPATEAYLRKRLAKAATQYHPRYVEAALYGRWDIQTLMDDALMPVWANLTKPEYRRRGGKL